MPTKKTPTVNGSKPANALKKKPREKTAAQKARDDTRRKMLAAKKQEMRAKLMEGNSTPEIIIT